MCSYTPEQYLQMIPQSAVKQCFMDAPGYNAAWDYHITPDGRHFIPCCAEGTFPEYVKLYEYFPKTNEIKLCFDLETAAVVYPRTIRPSKIHTSICSMGDGKLIMTTHTTASAPNHPCWMPEAYYGHMWEGFAGSNVLIYDMDTGKVEDLGIPVPRESIYGAVYLKEHNCLFFSGYFRGHVYRFDLADRSVTDYGQCTEFGVYYLKKASDRHIYFSTRSGALWRFRTDTLQPEYTGVDIPKELGRGSNGEPVPPSRTVLAYADNGPDGKLYFVSHIGCSIFSYDPVTNTLEKLALTMPKGLREAYHSGYVFGVAFDRYGKLWYTCHSNGLRLCCVDIMTPSAEPEDFGLIGTEKRGHIDVENIYIYDDVLYMSDTNHGSDAPGVVAVDLQKLREDAEKPRILCQDPMLYFPTNGKPAAPLEALKPYYRGDLQKDAQKAFDFDAMIQRDRKYILENPFAFGKGKRSVCKLWKQFGTRGSQVTSVSYDTQGRIQARIGAQGGLLVTVQDGEVVQWEKVTAVKSDFSEETARRFADYRLPAHPGRRYLAVASAYGTLADGSVLVGTKDGMLAMIRENKVFSLGAVCNDGPIRDIAVSPDGKTAYGVGGDPDSLGMIFTYDVQSGLELEGFLYFSNGAGKENVGVSCEPCCIAVAPDGKRVAIGVNDNLGCVYEIEV